MRQIITLGCTECKRRNYTSFKNKKNNPDRIEIKKYCKWCKKHTVHKETR
ncbi:MAG: 50S ribosomal protein L33 [Candidatus Humimicrobiaceae bacterium]